MQLAHALKLKVVSEGVETEEQFADCAVLGCDYVQGFLISVPVDAEAPKNCIGRLVRLFRALFGQSIRNSLRMRHLRLNTTRGLKIQCNSHAICGTLYGVCKGTKIRTVVP
jgi:EAL domain